MNWKNPTLISPDRPIYRWLVWLNIAFITHFAVASAGIGFVANSTIRGALMLSSDQQQWLSIAYIMMLANTLPIAIFCAERFGYKITFFMGIFFFGFGSLLDGMAGSFSGFMSSRMLAGAGAGTLFPTSLALIGKVFPRNQVSLAIAAFIGVAFGLGTAFGFIWGGLLTQFFGWEWGFLLCFFAALPALMMTALLVPESEANPTRKFDTIGFIPFTCFIGGTILTLANAKQQWNTEGWGSPFTISCIIVTVLGFILFMIAELRPKKDLLFNLRLFKNKSFLLGNITVFLTGAVLYSFQIVAPVFFDSILLYDRWTTGLFLCTTGFSLWGATAVATLLMRYINVRFVTLFGLAILIISCFQTVDITINSSHFQMLFNFNLKNIGTGFILGPATALALSSIEREDVGPGSLINNFCRQYGGTLGSLGTQVLTVQRSIFHADRFGSQVETNSPRFQEVVQRISDHLVVNSGALPSEAHDKAVALLRKNILSQSATAAMNDAFYILGIILFVVTSFLVLELLFDLWKKRVPTS